MANRTLTRPLPAAGAAAWRGLVTRLARGVEREHMVVGGLMLAGLLAHAVNMFGYPAYGGDEGIYAGQALSILREGRLTPYTYNYDHAPGGWILLALWMGITGGADTFGGAINSGRVLMLVMHLAMIPMIYRLAKKLGAPTWAAAAATLGFSLSPLAIAYQRMLLLDNFMMFWVLVALNLMLDGWGRLSRRVLAGAAFGMALLSKETAVFLLPAFAFVAINQRWRHHGRFSVLGWLAPLLMVASWYPLYALLKGELFPAWLAAKFALLGGAPQHQVSLFEALKWQASRGGGGAFNLNNDFWRLMRSAWLPADAFLIAGGAAAAGLNLLRGIRDRRALAAGLLGAMPFVYLARGAIVFDFYIIIAIPFLALNLAMAVAWVSSAVFARLPRMMPAVVAGAVVAAALAYTWSGSARPLFVDDATSPARDAVSFVKASLPADSRIIVRDDVWPDIRYADVGGRAFPNVHPHFKAASDPDVRDDVFHRDWRKVDYMVFSRDMERVFKTTHNEVALGALAHSQVVKRWSSGNQVLELRKVGPSRAREVKMLSRSEAHIAATFEKDGAYHDKALGVTSEAQSYAMLRAVWTGDRAGFDAAWEWTKENLFAGKPLPAWKWREGAVEDPNSATDADTDMALALLMGSKVWRDESLLAEGTAMVRALWDAGVAEAGGALHMTAGEWARGGPVLAVNPSYFAPYAYRIFAEVDPGHDWRALVDSGYDLLFKATADPLGHGRSAGLPPDWVGIHAATGRLVPLALEGRETTRYGYDAARTYWRVAIDLDWNGEGRAGAYLKSAGFLRDEVKKKYFPSAVYSHSGEVIEEAPSLVGSAGALAALRTLDREQARSLYTAQILGGTTPTEKGIAWGEPDDLYTQEWGWFAAAGYWNRLRDLWNHQPEER